MYDLTLRNYQDIVLSDAGHVYSASIYLDGKKIGVAENKGGGSFDNTDIDIKHREKFSLIANDILSKLIESGKKPLGYSNQDPSEAIISCLATDFSFKSSVKKFNKNVSFFTKDNKHMGFDIKTKGLTEKEKEELKTISPESNFNFEMTPLEIFKAFEKKWNMNFTIIGKLALVPDNFI